MAREPRLHLPYALYHVSLHANASQSLFLDKADGQHFYRLLEEGRSKYGHEILGFCLMDDHVHLAIQIAYEPLSNIIHNLTFRYTRWFNHRHQRQGHLFAGRYKATVVQQEKYLPDLIRYVHLTPVRLGIAARPEDYLWSSHRVYLGKENIAWVNTQALAQRFSGDANAIIEQYHDFILAGMQHGRPKDLAAVKFTSRVFGDEAFVKKTIAVADNQPLHKPASLDELMAIICHHYTLTEDELMSLGKQRSTSTARGVLAYLVKQCPNITFTDLAKRVNRDATTLSAHAARIEKLCKKDDKLAEFIQQIKVQIIHPRQVQLQVQF